jgi:hypothetical protein
MRPGLFVAQAIAAWVLPADWLPGPSYLQALLFLSWFWSSILFSSLECSVQRQKADHSEHERLTLAARLPAQLWLQPLPQARTAFGEKRRATGLLQSWQFPFECIVPRADEATRPEKLEQVI